MYLQVLEISNHEKHIVNDCRFGYLKMDVLVKQSYTDAHVHTHTHTHI